LKSSSAVGELLEHNMLVHFRGIYMLITLLSCPMMEWHVKGLSKRESEGVLGPGPVLRCQTWAFLLAKEGWAYALGPSKTWNIKTCHGGSAQPWTLS